MSSVADSDTCVVVGGGDTSVEGEPPADPHAEMAVESPPSCKHPENDAEMKNVDEAESVAEIVDNPGTENAGEHDGKLPVTGNPDANKVGEHHDKLRVPEDAGEVGDHGVISPVLANADKIGEQDDALPVSAQTKADEVGEHDFKLPVHVKKEPLEEQSEVPNSSEKFQDKSDDCVMMEYRTNGNAQSLGQDDTSDSSPDSSSDSSHEEEKNEHDTVEKKINKIYSADRDTSPDRTVKLNKHGYEDIRTKGEYHVEDLPPVEDLKITVDESTEMISIGTVRSTVGTLVVIEQTNSNISPLDIDTILFTGDRKIIGQIFEVLGPVVKPWYTVRFNSSEDIQDKGISVGTPIYYAPSENDFTKYVFVAKVKQQKGSDASWTDNNETPEKFQDFSDDEEERKAKLKRKGKKMVDEEEDSQQTTTHRKELPKKPHITQWPPKDDLPKRSYSGSTGSNLNQPQSRFPGGGQLHQNSPRQQQPRQAACSGGTQGPRWRPENPMQFGGPPRFNQGPRFNNRGLNVNQSTSATPHVSVMSSPGFINNSPQFGPGGGGGGHLGHTTTPAGRARAGSDRFIQPATGQFGQNRNLNFTGQGGNVQGGVGQFGMAGNGVFDQGGRGSLARPGMVGSGHFGQGDQREPPNNLSNTSLSGPTSLNNPHHQVASFFQSGQHMRPPPNFPSPPLFSRNTPPPRNQVDNRFLGPNQISETGKFIRQQGNMNAFSQRFSAPEMMMNSNNTQHMMQQNLPTQSKPGLIMDTRFIQNTD